MIITDALEDCNVKNTSAWVSVEHQEEWGELCGSLSLSAQAEGYIPIILRHQLTEPGLQCLVCFEKNFLFIFANHIIFLFINKCNEW